MALEVSTQDRKFVLKKNGQSIPLNDPDPRFSPESVMSFYSTMYPELTVSTLYGPLITGEGIEYEFRTTVGVKG